MTPLALSQSGLVTCVGRGAEATLAALRAHADELTPCDFRGIAHGYVGRVKDVEAHRLPDALAAFDCRNNRLADMALGTDGFDQKVAEATGRLGPSRIAVVVGTSTSGVLACEDAYRDRHPDSGLLPDSFDYARTHDLRSLAWFVQARLGLGGPAFTVSTACASSARAFLDAAHLIEAGVADAAVVGGADSLCRLTLSGFAALDLISDGPCRPCDAERAGLSIGEAAGFCLLERDAPGVALLGAGASSDGYHMSSPRPDGAGAALAMRRALTSAGVTAEGIDHVNLHGTGTRANDAAEDAAVYAVFGERVPCASSKGLTGHTMGSCGVVEAILSKLCIENGLLPGTARIERVDPAFRMRVAVANENRPVRRVVSNSFGFGGVNVSLVLGVPAA